MGGATREHLILDCYLDEVGAAASFAPLVGDRPARVVRPAHGPFPARADEFAALWITGSAASVLDPLPWIDALVALCRDALERDVPVLGVCFGHQVLARAHGGPAAVRASATSELGWAEIERTAANPLFDDVAPRFGCFVSHFDEVAPGVPGLDVFARSARCAVHAFQVRGRRAWGVQFHPEMPPEECERLVRVNLAKHAHLGPDPAPVLARAVDGRPVGRTLSARFLSALEPAQPKRPVT